MALKNPSLILYGYSIDITNQFIDFKSSSIGPVITATIPAGDYNLTDLMTQIAAALMLADPLNTYTVSVNRTIAGGTQNRVTIATNGAYLSLLFSSGAHAAASPAYLLGFQSYDQNGKTSYTATSSSGTIIIPVQNGYNWVSPTRNRVVMGSVNVAASGSKEAITFQLQQFFSVDFRYETENTIDDVWQYFFNWAIQQKEFEFTPEITNPNVFYPCTLETTEEAGNGLAWQAKEMLPEFPGLYQLGKMKFRVILQTSQFISGT
jgi:hypothetical protein